MDRINFSKTEQVEQTKNLSSYANNTYKTKPYALDSFEKNRKNAKKFSFKGLGDATKAIDSLKEFGIKCFKEGIAFGEDGQKFTGKIRKTTRSGDIFEVNFFNGKITCSTKNPDSSFFGEMEKYYDRNIITGKLQKVETRTKKGAIAVTKFDNDKIITYAKDISKNPELIRIQNSSDEEIIQEAQSILSECFKKKGLDKSLMPKVILEKTGSLAAYYEEENLLAIDPAEYRKGLLSLHDLIMHEATHCEKATLRARLPQEIKEKVIQEELIRKVLEGDNRYASIIGGGTIVPPPKMSEKMKKEFVEIAKKSIYIKGDLDKTSEIDFKGIAEKLVKENPDFAKKYKNTDTAVNHMEDYIKSHYTRYNYHIKSSQEINVANLPSLTPSQTEEAIESCKQHIDCIDVNKAKYILDGRNVDRKYHFDYLLDCEESLASNEGHTYGIEKLGEKIEKLKAEGKLTPRTEGYYLNLQKNNELLLEYRNKLAELNKFEKRLGEDSTLMQDNDFTSARTKALKELKAIKAKLESLENLPIASIVYRQAK